MKNNNSKDTEYFQCPRPVIEPLKPGKNSREITFPVSYTYNGGMVKDDKWYKGYHVPAPVVPEDCEIVSLGVGLQMNAQPPFCTMLLRRKKD
jgi:hypothetical protein